MQENPHHKILIIMGVSGCGKTAVGEALAARLSCPYLEGDRLHSQTNIAKMKSGIPLNDDDRLPWLYQIGAHIDDWQRAAQTGVISCSSLKRCYRAILRYQRRSVAFVYLKADEALLEARLRTRQHDYWPAHLLASQFAALEEPHADEDIVTLSADRTLEDIVTTIASRFCLS